MSNTCYRLERSSIVTTKVSVITLGCAKNQVDSEVMSSKLIDCNMEITSDLDKAMVIIVNTCGFIDSAKEESINKILELAAYKEQGVCKSLVVVGCLVQKYQEQLASSLPEVDAWLGTDQFESIAQIIQQASPGEKIIKVNGDIKYVYQKIKRFSNTPRYSAYLKISEGCDNHCSYCAIPAMRGRYKSRDMQMIVAEAKELAAAGVIEINLIAQDTTSYGIDLYGQYKLVDLVKELIKIEEIKWIRLLYCYPTHFDKELIFLMKQEEKICKYLDMPLQHADNEILNRMNRKSDIKEVSQLLGFIKKEIPEISLRTTFIVGFPGESKENFKNLLQFIKDNKFHWLGVFPYSREEGTPAYNMDKQIAKKTKLSRAEKIMKIQQEITRDRNLKYLGKLVTVLVEGISKESRELYHGRTQFQAPEVDGITLFTSPLAPKKGSLVKVKITHVDNYDLIGEMVP